MPDATLHLGDWRDILPTLDTSRIAAVVTDPPYGMKWDTDSTRFSGGRSKENRYLHQGRSDWGAIESDDEPFDPSPWLGFPKVVLWGANHYAARLPVGTTLVWLKKGDNHFGTFLSDAEIGWQKGGHGVYAFRKNFPPSCRIQEGGIRGKAAHPTQKPVGLMRWCIARLKLPPGSTILDPYMGSGTTGVAAVELGHDFIGIEVKPAHFATADRRVVSAAAASAPPARETA
jgi:DNA modification methylase